NLPPSIVVLRTPGTLRLVIRVSGFGQKFLLAAFPGHDTPCCGVACINAQGSSEDTCRRVRARLTSLRFGKFGMVSNKVLYPVELAAIGLAALVGSSKLELLHPLRMVLASASLAASVSPPIA